MEIWFDFLGWEEGENFCRNFRTLRKKQQILTLLNRF
jgi:hypothetical protein